MRLGTTVALALLALTVATPAAPADKKTVCTITVNSSDEKEAFRRNLPADKYQFVELVERGRPDWLSSACRAGVQCDMLIISGHYDGGHEFFSEHVEASEFLPVAEMERASCGGSCGNLFSRLKEVYLFGCNTLNPEARRSVSANVVSSLVQGGLSRPEAERLVRSVNARYGESSRDRMRLVFKDVPVIYGFSSVAPLGPTAAGILNRYFQTAGTSEIGTGRPSPRMLGQFATHSLTVTRGMSDADPLAGVRRDVCQFADDRTTDAEKLDFVHQVLQRPAAEVRMLMDRIDRYVESLDDPSHRSDGVDAALAAIAKDEPARNRYLAFAREADPPAERVQMLDLARDLGWLTPAQRQTELAKLLNEFLARDAIGPAEVDLACTVNQDGGFDGLFDDAARHLAAADVAHTAIRACLGNDEARARTLEALVSASDQDVLVAQTYFRHRPITTVDELRSVTSGIARMRGSDAQVRALHALAGQSVSDPESLEVLAELFPRAETWSVQSAIAGVLIRADYRSIARPDIVQSLRENRRKSPSGQDVIDALIRRLQSP
jgi:hypothetical protein